MLPQEFVTRMKKMLGDEYADFEAGYEKEKHQALRLNPRKVRREEFLASAPFVLTEVPWEKNGFYYRKEDTPGKHPYHDAGVYYIQEPSAMLPAMLLDAREGERVLDLCASPGGKSTQLGAAMNGKGILVCNEIHPARAKILSENIERMGIVNALVLNETPQKLSEVFGGYFDKILVDAPCSGEGMFRKNEKAEEQWSPENVRLCADRQDEIMDYAAEMLRPGGRLVYSTCTFAPDENEGTIGRFLKRHADFAVETVPIPDGMESGRPEWCGIRTDRLMQDEESSYVTEGIEATIRLWPHKINGEGHYAAVLRRMGDASLPAASHSLYGEEKETARADCKEYLEFEAACLKQPLEGKLLQFGEQLYLMPQEMPSLRTLRALRPGLHLGTRKKNRFEPSHALALALDREAVRYSCDLSADSPQLAGYQNGQTFPYEGEKGWYLISVDGYSIGWGKLAGGTMKNHYPKGLRKNL